MNLYYSIHNLNNKLQERKWKIMATYPVVCPCGKLLGSTIKHGAGTKRCTACKKNVRYKEKDGVVYTNYEK